MTRPLALHHLTVREVPVVELIEIAASLGCSDVCVFTHSPRVPIPGAAFTQYPTVNAGNKIDILTSLLANGVGVGNIEFFPVTESLELDDYVPAFEVGAQIGAKRAVTHIHDTNPARAVDTLGQLCDLAAQFDLRLGLEFMGLTPACGSIRQAQQFVANVGRKNIGIALDALHLIRTGGTPDEISSIPPEQFCYAQICDGFGFQVTADYRAEGQDRQAPGDGDWPLRQIFAALPEITPIDVEVPSTSQTNQNVPAMTRARRAVDQSRELLNSIPSMRRYDRDMRGEVESTRRSGKSS